MDEPPALPGVTHRFEEARDGVRLHVAEAGDPEAPVAVLLHGWPQCWWMWRHLIPVLAASRRVLAFDLRGFGWSDAPPAGYRKDELAEDVLAVLDRLGVRRAAFVGHDWGAFIAYRLAVMRTDRVERVAALSAPPPGTRIGLRDVTAVRGFLHIPVLGMPVLGPRAAGSRAFNALVERAARGRADAWSDEDREIYVGRPARDPARARAAAALYRTFLWQEAPGALFGRPASHAPVPVLALHGERDPVEARLVPDAVVVPGAGHWLPEEAPDEVGRHVGEFLEQGTP